MNLLPCISEWITIADTRLKPESAITLLRSKQTFHWLITYLLYRIEDYTHNCILCVSFSRYLLAEWTLNFQCVFLWRSLKRRQWNFFCFIYTDIFNQSGIPPVAFYPILNDWTWNEILPTRIFSQVASSWLFMRSHSRTKPRGFPKGGIILKSLFSFKNHPLSLQ